MVIFQMVDPFNYDFARASLRGTWTQSKGTCPECTASSEERIQPLIIEWEPDSDLVGDFVWPGFSFNIAIRERVMKALKQQFSGFEPGPVEMIQDPKLKRTKKAKPRVWLPYDGPPLVDLWVTSWANIDQEASTTTLEYECSVCGRKQYKAHGVERRETRWDPDRRKPIRSSYPREAGKGLAVQRIALDGADIFHLEEFPGAIFCTRRVKDMIEAEGFTNAAFLEMGEVI